LDDQTAGDERVHLSDEALVDELRSGSMLAFAVLMKRYEKLVYRIAFDHARNQDCALDITQNVFLNAHQKLHSYSGSGLFKAWLLRIAYNESISWFRRHKGERITEELTPLNAPALRSVQVDEFARNESRNILLGELKKLSAKQRLAVSLRYFEDFSLREIAAVIDCSEGTVKSILFRSLEKLRNTKTFQRRRDYAQL
jgi:RNA polymerase sigma-70 factor (ECF subfamily)